MEKTVIDRVALWQLEVGDCVDLGDGTEQTIKTISDETIAIYITTEEGEEHAFYNANQVVDLLGYES